MAEVIVRFKAEVDGFQNELKKAEQSIFNVDAASDKAASETARSFQDAASKVNKSTKEIEKGIKDAFNGKSIDAFIKEATRSGQTVQELKKSLRDLKNASFSVDANSEAFRKLTKAAGQITDEVGDLNQRIKNLSSDTQRLDALINIGQGIAGGFALAQGGAALFGAESEELQKTLVKLQAAQNVMNGLQQVANVLNKDSAASTFLAGTAQKAYALAVGTSTGALKAFRLALIATGIGALIAGIATLIAYWDKVSGAIDKVSEKLGDNAGKVKVLVGVLIPLVGVILLVKKAMDAMSDGSESLTERMDKQSAKLKEQIAIYEATGRSKKEIIALQKEELKARAIAAMAIKDEAEREKALSMIRIEYIGLLKSKNEIEKKEIEDLEKKRKEAWEKEKRRMEEEQKLYKQLIDERLKTFVDGEEKEKAMLKEAARTRLAEIKGNSKVEEDLRIAIKNNLEKDLAAIDKKYRDEEEKLQKEKLEKLKSFREAEDSFNKMVANNRKSDLQLALDDFALLKTEYDKGIINFEDYERRRTAIAEREFNARKKIKDSEVNLALATTDALTGLAQLVASDSKELAEYEKQIAILNIGIKTAEALANIVAAATTKSLTPVEVALKIAANSAIVFSNMARAKAILSAPVPDVPAFAEGTERVTGGVKGKDSVLSLLMPDEAVIKAKENMKHAGLAKAWNAGRLEDYIADKWVLPALVKQQKAYEQSKEISFAKNIANSIMFNDKNLIRAHKAGMRTQWETAEYLADVIKKSKRNPYSPIN